MVPDPLRLLACDAASHSETDLGLVAVIWRLRGQLRGRRGLEREGSENSALALLFFGGGGGGAGV